jgi:hypothetical protein
MFEKIFGDYVDMGISLIASALLIGGISICISLSDQYHEKQLENQITATTIKEQRNNLFYNNTDVYQQDIISLIIKYKGDKEVRVRLSNGTIYSWTNASRSSDYKVSDISALLPKDVLYESDIIYGPNRYDVVGYQFVGQ